MWKIFKKNLKNTCSVVSIVVSAMVVLFGGVDPIDVHGGHLEAHLCVSSPVWLLQTAEEPTVLRSAKLAVLKVSVKVKMISAHMHADQLNGKAVCSPF